MARRTVATIHRPDPHDYDEDPDAPGACRCRLLQRNDVHSAQRIAAHRAELATQAARLAAAQDAHRRRLGDRDA